MKFLSIQPSMTVSIPAIPVLVFDDFRTEVIESVRSGSRLIAFYGFNDTNTSSNVKLLVVLADDRNSVLYIASTVIGNSFRSLTPACPQAHLFEREIAEQWGVKPEGHPWLKPVRFHAPYCKNKNSTDSQPNPELSCGIIDFFQVKGEEVHEVAVGPVHAGIIEPGHFRFQCYGENVFNLEISLGYQHRGIERRLIGGPDKRTVHYMETLAGDTTIGHALAYCQAIESFTSAFVPLRAQILRTIALELERIANHVGDLGALANDIAFLPTASFCGRIRGDFLNMTAMFCGNRFGRGFICPGGVGYNLNQGEIQELRQKILTLFPQSVPLQN